MATPPSLPIDYTALRIAMLAAMRTATGLDQNHVIMFEPEVAGSPRPSRPYMTLKIVTAGARYGDDVPTQQQDAQGNLSTVWNSGGPRMMACDFNAYAATHEDAYALAALWQASLDSVPTQESLRQAGIAVWLIGSVSDLSVLLNTGYEGRAHLDCRFGVASNLTVDLGSMDTFTVDGQVLSGTLSTSLEVTVKD